MVQVQAEPGPEWCLVQAPDLQAGQHPVPSLAAVPDLVWVSAQYLELAEPVVSHVVRFCLATASLFLAA